MVLRSKVLYARRVGGRTISEQVLNRDETPSIHREKRWYKRWWAWCLWVFMGLLLALIIFGIWAWSQRYALMENFIIDTFADSGFEAELDIVSATSSQAQFRDIHLRREGEEVLRIADLRAEYMWPDIREGQLIRLEVTGLAGRLALGEDWRPSEDWLKELLPETSSGGEESGAGFPEKGIRLSESSLTLLSPLGEQTFKIEADISAPDVFIAEISLPLSDLSYGDVSAKGSATVSLESLGGDEIITQGSAQTETLSNSNHRIEDAQLGWNGTVNTTRRVYDGHVSVNGNDITGEIFAATSARLQWDGQAALNDQSYQGKLTVESQDISSALFAADGVELSWDGHVSTAEEAQAKGRWSISADQARTARRARAAEVAETLSLFPALSVVPVTEYYAEELKKTVEALLLGADVRGEGDLDYGAAGFKLSPIGDISIRTPDNNLSLVPHANRDFFAFDAEAQSILAQMDAVFEAPVGLTLKDIELRAKSKNGVSLGGVDSFASNLETTQNWPALDEEMRPVRLGPLAASLKYTGDANPRHLTVETALDYDGSLPGGRVEALNLEGRLDVRLYEDRQVLDFTPLDGRQITLKSMETPTAWFGEDMRFTLLPTPNLFTRTASESTLVATLTMADFTLTQPATPTTEAQRLDVQSEALKLNGSLFPDQTQNWTVGFEGVSYESQTLPGPGTTAAAQEATLTARLVPDTPPQITLNSPSVTAETPLARLSDFEIALSGTPENYSVDHKGGSVDVIGSDFADLAEKAGLASFPAVGNVEFVDGRFIGKSNLVVAKADDADVSVEYEFANGVGKADIDIPSILFTPKGLQPQSLVPAFRGKIAQVEGEARAKVKIAFADGALTDSSGTVQLVDMSVGTAPGPITGLNTTLEFDSLWPLETNGQQKMTLESFNPGLPLEDGVMTFDLVPDGVKVYSADWPIGNGTFSLTPFTWVYGAEENRVTMQVKNVALGDFLDGFGNQKIQATGLVVGEFPVVVRGIEVLIEDGTIAVPDGGVITYEPGPNVPTYTEEEAIAIFRQRRSSEYASLAQDALRQFRYKELSATIDGPLEGDVEIGLVFDGSNAKVLNRQPFRFDISVKGELFNIARSFNSNAQVKSEILRQNGQLPEGTIIGEN